MVKRVIAMAAGAIAGIALWYAFEALASGDGPIGVTPEVATCVPDEAVDCVRFDGRASLPTPAVAAPCKEWLAGDMSATTLAACLHARRASEGAVDALVRRRAAAGSI